jgi:hypothetical protein
VLRRRRTGFLLETKTRNTLTKNGGNALSHRGIADGPVGSVWAVLQPSAKPTPAVAQTMAATTSKVLNSSGRAIAKGMSTKPRTRQTAAMPASAGRSKGRRRISPAAEQAYEAQSPIRAAMTAAPTGANHVPSRAEATTRGGAPKKVYQDGPAMIAPRWTARSKVAIPAAGPRRLVASGCCVCERDGELGLMWFGA